MHFPPATTGQQGAEGLEELQEVLEGGFFGSEGAIIRGGGGIDGRVKQSVKGCSSTRTMEGGIGGRLESCIGSDASMEGKRSTRERQGGKVAGRSETPWEEEVRVASSHSHGR